MRCGGDRASLTTTTSTTTATTRTTTTTTTTTTTGTHLQPSSVMASRKSFLPRKGCDNKQLRGVVETELVNAVSDANF